ncbi:MAG: MFS transporter [Firmicutes bacterium]|nr:MFS transporter [Bacillota bacterium]
MNNNKKLAIRFILLFGLISAFGDITYEGARSVYGPYLGFLEAGAAVVGFVSGFGEFLGYALRLGSGYLLDKTRKYWLVTILGYAMLISVPLLAMAGKWQIAALLIIIERAGKAIRSPGKDAMLSHATKQVGTGFGFGIHEALDQIGGIIGPLIFTFALAFAGGYRQGFTYMWIPAILTVLTILYTSNKFPNPSELEDWPDEDKQKTDTKQGLPKIFWYYALFTFVSVLGFVHFSVISYHFMARSILSESFIPTLYAIAMAVDGIFALLIGKFYDKIGLASLILIPVLTLPVALLGFSLSPAFAIVSIILWGCVMSIHETVMRATIADIIPIAKRGTAYGIFNTLYGFAFLIGSTVMGYLYEHSITYVIIFILISEALAMLAYVFFRKNLLLAQ